MKIIAAFFYLISFLINGCAFSGPATAYDCSSNTLPTSGGLLQANAKLKNNTNKRVKRMSLLLRFPSGANMRFDFNTTISPWQEVSARSALMPLEPGALREQIKQYTGTAASCYLGQVEYADGSVYTAPTPAF